MKCWLTISRQAAEDMGVEHNGMPAYGKPASSSRVDMGVEHSGMLAYNKPASSRVDMGVEHNGMPAYGKPASSSRGCGCGA